MERRPRLTAAVAVLLIAAAISTWFLPFWLAIAVYVAFILWAAYEVFVWMRACRHAEQVRVFIQGEIDRMPRRDELTRREVVLTVASEFPKAWEPFIDRDAQTSSAQARRPVQGPTFVAKPGVALCRR